MPSIQKETDSETSSATTAVERRPGIGRLSRARVVGAWNCPRPIAKIRDCEALPGVCSSSRFRRRWNSAVLVPGPIPLLGIQEYLNSYPGDRDAQKIRSVLSLRLLEMYESIRSPDWKWFENVLAYGNARLPQAMLLVGTACSDDRMVSAGLEALDWLTETQRCETDRHFVPIGSQGFYRQGGEKARFDQQPIEAARRGVCVSRSVSRNRRQPLAQRGLVRFQLVSRRQRSATSSL